jgi:hypothetical protein
VDVFGDHPNRPIPQLARIEDSHGMNHPLNRFSMEPGWFTQVGDATSTSMKTGTRSTGSAYRP